jgi:hypothetical protein
MCLITGTQFCRGFGGIGAILRYPVQFLDESDPSFGPSSSYTTVGMTTAGLSRSDGNVASKSSSLDALLSGLDLSGHSDDEYEDYFYQADEDRSALGTRTGRNLLSCDDLDLMFGVPTAPTDGGGSGVGKGRPRELKYTQGPFPLDPSVVYAKGIELSDGSSATGPAAVAGASSVCGGRVGGKGAHGASGKGDYMSYERGFLDLEEES